MGKGKRRRFELSIDVLQYFHVGKGKEHLLCCIRCFRRHSPAFFLSPSSRLMQVTAKCWGWWSHRMEGPGHQNGTPALNTYGRNKQLQGICHLLYRKVVRNNTKFTGK